MVTELSVLFMSHLGDTVADNGVEEGDSDNTVSAFRDAELSGGVVRSECSAASR